VSDLLYENRMRLKYNHYAYTTAFRRLKNAIEKNNDHEIYTAIGELLLWVMTTHEWYIKYGLSDYEERAKQDNNGTLLYGLRHAYNSMKHNMNFFVIHNKKQGFSFDNIDYSNWDFRPIIITWSKAINKLEEGKETQIVNYKKHIEDQEVLETFEKVLVFLNSEYQKVIFEK
jgi:hypothetical protein